MPALTIKCPFCGNPHSDEFECLDPAGAQFFRCENPKCSTSFVFLIHECTACVEDSVFVWKEMPQSAVVAKLVCQHCAEPVSQPTEQTHGEDTSHRI
jgi:hypothetical protein